MYYTINIFYLVDILDLISKATCWISRMYSGNSWHSHFTDFPDVVTSQPRCSSFPENLLFAKSLAFCRVLGNKSVGREAKSSTLARWFSSVCCMHNSSSSELAHSTVFQRFIETDWTLAIICLMRMKTSNNRHNWIAKSLPRIWYFICSQESSVSRLFSNAVIKAA